jgi:hypothetical protein
MAPQCFQQLRHKPATQIQGFPMLSAWRANRPSRQVRRKRGRREPFSAVVPPEHPPAHAQTRRETCDSEARLLRGREFVTARGGVAVGTRAQPSLARVGEYIG